MMCSVIPLIVFFQIINLISNGSPRKRVNEEPAGAIAVPGARTCLEGAGIVGRIYLERLGECCGGRCLEK